MRHSVAYPTRIDYRSHWLRMGRGIARNAHTYQATGPLLLLHVDLSKMQLWIESDQVEHYCETKEPTTCVGLCGRGGIRTLDLYSAIVALSQLSYAPWKCEITL